jgi:hypothetical protein
MKNDVPIPENMRYLPRDKRGYPIPTIVFRDSDGNPHFTINAEERREFVLKLDRCGICNHPLSRGRWFVGGPLSAFHERGAFIDPPMHHACAQYALRVCPYLAMPSWTHSIEAKTLDPKKIAVPILVDHTVDNTRPDFFICAMAIGQRRNENGYIIPKRPYRRVEFWAHGKCLAIRRGEVLAGHIQKAAELSEFLKEARA